MHLQIKESKNDFLDSGSVSNEDMFIEKMTFRWGMNYLRSRPCSKRINMGQLLVRPIHLRTLEWSPSVFWHRGC